MSPRGERRSTLEALPEFAPAFAARGALLAEHDQAAALVNLNRAIQLDPRSPALKTRALMHLSEGKYDEAISDLDRAIAIDGKDAVAFLNRGSIHAERGDLERSIQDSTRAIELKPDSAKAHYNRGISEKR